MFLKIHRQAGMPEVVAVCDAELLNTTIRHGDLSVQISDTFYGTCRADAGEVAEAIRNAENINLIGERCVALAVEMGLVTRAGCIMIGTVPHAQVYRL